MKSMKHNILEDKVCLVVPFYNEQQSVAPFIEEWISVLTFHKIKYQILAINCGSTDDTRGVLRSLASVNSAIVLTDIQNEGYGQCLKRGLLEATNTNSRWIFHTDSNGELRALDFLKLWKERNSFHTQIGYRANFSGLRIKDICSNLISKFASLLYQTSLKDIDISYRLYESTHLKNMLHEIPSVTCSPNVFLSLLAARTSKGMRQIPVVHRRRIFGASSTSLFSFIAMQIQLFFELCAFRSIYNFKVKEVRKLSQKEAPLKVTSK